MFNQYININKSDKSKNEPCWFILKNSIFNILGFADPEFMNIMKTRRVTTDEKDQGCEGEPV